MSDAPLLDTHAWVWWVQGDARLGRHIVQKLDELAADDRPAISDISLWEVATLASLGRIEFPGTLESWLALAANQKTVRILPITSRIAAEVARLPDSFQRDPADRLIVATSRVHGLRVLTKDTAIAKSGLVKLWSAGAAKRVTLRARFPRVFELKDRAQNPDHEHAYFRGFEASLDSMAGKQDTFIRLESQLAHLDETSWRDLRGRVARHLGTTPRDTARGWQQLFDSLNAARAYGYLLRIGCSDIHFVPDGQTKSPDLEGQVDGRPLLCEVKTLDLSDEKAARNLSREFLDQKLAPAIEQAVKLLSNHDPDRHARWIVYLVVNWDESVADYDQEYVQQIDDYLSAHHVAGAEIILAPLRNNFQRMFAMRSATVDRE